MSVITISRQMGSLGGEIARLAAERLGYRLVWRDLINEAARRAGVPEMALAAIDELGLLGVSPSQKAYQSYREAMAQVMEEQVAIGDAVIVGRAGQVILGHRPDVLHVRINAPLDIRVQRVAARHNIALEQAQAQVKASDRYRISYLKRFYQVKWDNSDFYDLVINTRYLTAPDAAEILFTALAVHRASIARPSQQEPSLDLD
jgi:cytidylate kinase